LNKYISKGGLEKQQTSQKDDRKYYISFNINADCEQYQISNQRHRLADWIKKTKPKHLLPTRNAPQLGASDSNL
jgi:hypothetical protein